METKFKIGDIISDKQGYDLRQVIDVVFEQKEVFGFWLGGSKSQLIKDSYVLLNEKTMCLTYLGFSFEKEYNLVSQPLEIVLSISVVKEISCPRCGSSLIEKMSVGLGEMIKKCSNPNCEWC